LIINYGNEYTNNLCPSVHYQICFFFRIGYDPPTRFSVVRHLKRLHKFHFNKLIDDLALVDNISITLDLWSNKQMRSFLVITGHYFPNNSFNLQSTVLNFSSFNIHHQAVDILRVLQEKLKELNILHKVVGVTADGGRNVVRAICDLDLNLERVWCVAHRLHLSVTNAFGFWSRKKEDNIYGATTSRQSNSNCFICFNNKNIYNLSIFETILIFYLGNSNTGLNDSENGEFVNDDIDEPDELIGSNMDVVNDESDDDESLKTYDSNDEETLFDGIDEEFSDAWTTDFTQSDFNVVDEHNMIISIVKKCRGLMSMIKRSTIITLYFDNQRKQSNIKRNLRSDVKSRWNSTYSMIDSFLALREVIQQLFRDKHKLKIKPKQVGKLGDFELTSDDWNVLTILHSILKPFYHATKAMSGSRYPTIGLAFYVLTRLKNFLQHHDKKESLMEKRFKQLLLKQLLHYFESDDKQLELLKVSTVCTDVIHL
jgi:hypothetical protein